MHLVTDEVNPEAMWVFKGEGTPTRKFDGTACLYRDRKLYKRYTLRQDKIPPPGFEPSTEMDPGGTGKQEGWIPVGDGPEDKHHRAAFACREDHRGKPLVEGKTYELCGPKVQKNPEGFDRHVLVPHGCQILEGNVPRYFSDLYQYLRESTIEGIVWHHPDGRMAKIKARDFGLSRMPVA